MLSPQLRAALLAQASCSNTELRNFLDNEVDFIYECQNDDCNEQLRYLYTLLGLIEAAQIYSRNKIDTMQRNMQSQMRETYSARSNRKMDAERDSNSKSCAWSAATSAQYFNRDSQDWTQGYSESVSHRTAEKSENGYDKSCRHTTGHGFHFSRVNTRAESVSGEDYAPGFGTDESHVIHSHNRTSSTGPYFPPAGLAVTIGVTDTPPYFGFVQPALPGFPVPGSSEDFCPTPTEEDPFPECQTGNYPSYGQGWSGNFKASLQLPLLGTLSIEYNKGFNQRQYFVCGSGESVRTSVHDGLLGSESFTETIALPENNVTSSREKSDVVHLVRKYGTSTRRGNDQTDAEETQRGSANGLAHSESQRDNESNGFSQARAESFTTAHSETHLRRNENATDDIVANKFGQISQHLGEMWKRIWARLQLLEHQYAAIPVGGKMNCQPVRNNPCPCPLRVPYATLGRLGPVV